MESIQTPIKVPEQPTVDPQASNGGITHPLNLTGTMNGNVSAEGFHSAEDWLEWASQLG